MIRKIIVVTAIVGALFAAVEVDAKASPQSYVNELADANYNGPVDVWMEIGYDVCQLQRSGVPLALIVDKIVLSTGEGIYAADAVEIIGIANRNLCGGGYLA